MRLCALLSSCDHQSATAEEEQLAELLRKHPHLRSSNLLSHQPAALQQPNASATPSSSAAFTPSAAAGQQPNTSSLMATPSTTAPCDRDGSPLHGGDQISIMCGGKAMGKRSRKVSVAATAQVASLNLDNKDTWGNKTKVGLPEPRQLQLHYC